MDAEALYTLREAVEEDVMLYMELADVARRAPTLVTDIAGSVARWNRWVKDGVTRWGSSPNHELREQVRNASRDQIKTYARELGIAFTDRDPRMIRRRRSR